MAESLTINDLGRVSYAGGLAAQAEAFARVLAARDGGSGATSAGEVLLLEHDPPVITIGRRPGSREHLLATPQMLARAGVEVAETDRGGDITYHGPGQLVAYPILDLNALGWNLHRYMRELEGVAIRVCAAFGVPARREEGATGVWVDRRDGQAAKICAMGVRVRRWITSHGLALNVTTDLERFGLIVPCGLAGRPVTSLARELGEAPPMARVKEAVAREVQTAVGGTVGSARTCGVEADADPPLTEPVLGR